MKKSTKDMLVLLGVVAVGVVAVKATTKSTPPATTPPPAAGFGAVVGGMGDCASCYVGPAAPIAK